MPGILERLRGRGRNSTIQAYTGVLPFMGKRYDVQGWTFTRVAASVYNNPTGYRAINAVVNNLCRPPWQVTPLFGGDTVEHHPLLGLMANPYPAADATGMSDLLWRHAMWTDMELAGRHVSVRIRPRDVLGNPYGQTLALRRLAIQRITVVGNADDELLGFVYTDRNGNQGLMLPADVLYLRYPHPERAYDGYAPGLVAGLPAETDSSAGRFNNELLNNDGALPGYLMVEGLSAESFAEFKALWEANENPGKTRFLEGSKATYVKVGQSNQEMTYKDLRDDAQRDILKAIGVAPAVAFDLSRETYANADAEKRVTWEQSFLPKGNMAGDQATLQLGMEYTPPVRLGFDTSDIEELAESADAKAQRAVLLRNAHITLVEESRDTVGLKTTAAQKAELNSQSASATDMSRLDNTRTSNNGSPANGAAKGKGPPLDGGPRGKGVPALESKEQKALALEVKGRNLSVYMTLHERHAARVQGVVARNLDRQRAAVLATAARLRGKTPPDDLAAALLNRQRFDDELTADLQAALGDAADAFGLQALLGRPHPWVPEAVAATVTAAALLATTRIQQTTEQGLRDALGLGLGMAEAVEAVFSAAQIASRSEAAGVTEVTGMASAGIIAAGVLAGDTHKRWVAVQDDDTDEECEDLDDTVVEINDTFPGGDPPLHVRCRCTVETTTPEETE